MHTRLFRLLEKHQRIDEALRRASCLGKADPFEVHRLRKLKRRVKQLINRLVITTARA